MTAPPPNAPSSGANAMCPVCTTAVAPGMPYCPACGTRVGANPDRSCPRCGEGVTPTAKFCATCGQGLEADAGADNRPCPRCEHRNLPTARFCANCGYGLSSGARGEARTSSFTVPKLDLTVGLVRIDESGNEVSTHAMTAPRMTIGRSGTDLEFEEDPYLSPKHAELVVRDQSLYVRDLGSRNGTWCFLDGAYRLQDGDLILVGSQIIRYRRLGYPGPNPPEADATRRLGSLTPSADIASLTQLRSDGSSRDVIHLSPGRNITIGRDQGDWLFSYDPSMSGLHAQIRSEDADFSIVDAGSRNGVAITARGDIKLNPGSRFLVGDKMFRVEIS